MGICRPLTIIYTGSLLDDMRRDTFPHTQKDLWLRRHLSMVGIGSQHALFAFNILCHFITTITLAAAAGKNDAHCYVNHVQVYNYAVCVCLYFILLTGHVKMFGQVNDGWSGAKKISERSFVSFAFLAT